MIDQMAYNYPSGTNKLTHIGDFVADNAFTYDIDNQSANNYTYDAIGNLTQDVKGGINDIMWNPYGKITHISKGTNGNLYYDYDAMGNRVKKNFTQSNDNADNTWYVRDASGNIMAIYSRKNYGTNQQVLLENYELYGSSRLGSLNLGMAVEGDYNLTATTNYTRSLGLKQYELSNHLGNVLTTFSDQRVFAPAGMSSTNSNALIAKLISAQDYYPFGMIMAGRSWNTDKVKFGFNGKENDNEVKGIGNQQDYGMRIYDTRIGKFLSVDPLADSYPWYTPYQFAGNTPIQAIDLDGLEPWQVNGMKSTINSDKNSSVSHSSLFSGTVYGPYLDLNAATQAAATGQATMNNCYLGNQIITAKYFGINNSFTDIAVTTKVGYFSHYTFGGNNSMNNGIEGGSFSFVNTQQEHYFYQNGPSGSGACYSTDVPSELTNLFIREPLQMGLEGLGMSENAAYWTSTGVTFGGTLALGFVKTAPKINTNVLSKGEFLRIENAATRINKPITVVGSRAIPGRVSNGVNTLKGTMADWDYVIEGLNSKNWSKIKNSLPGARSVLDNTPRNIDIFKGPVKTNLPYITIYPR